MEIKILKIEPKREPEVIVAENSLSSMQRLVHGYLECICLSDTAYILIDEEGKCKENPVGNRRFNGDVIVGTMLIVGVKGSEFISLSDADMERYRQMFLKPEDISLEEIKAHSGFSFSFF